MARKFYDIKYKGKKGGVLNTTVLANTVKDIKNNAKKLGFNIKSITPHRTKGGWGF